MFRTLLIANRGEIAARVARTARAMGIRTIAVHSDADANAFHVRACDAAIRIGPAPATESYLSIPAMIAAARETDAQAIHPGYGFLSENADFADACAQAGLVFVGPPAGAIRAMGSKAAARALMTKAGVPVVPGYQGADQSESTLAREAARIGFPVLFKPARGGGGKGMRRVDGAAGFALALEATQRKSLSSFGDAEIVVERYVERPRHVEVQVFADTQGHVVHLFERDCSLQRRHQKVIEEAPAPGLDPGLRVRLHAAAIAAAQAVGYVNAGTVEFILGADGAFYFMEMNTRLQVENPVTEMITGLDLIEWQLRVAAGEALPLQQDQIVAQGHAVEARLCAEAPEREFLPSPGMLTRFGLPEGEGIRIDAGVASGDRITPFYDPMIAKVIARGDSRAAALDTLNDALATLTVDGVATNRALLLAMTRNADFAAGRIHTQWLDTNLDVAVPGRRPASPAQILLALSAHLADRSLEGVPAAGDDSTSPWNDRTGWRSNLPAEEHFLVDGGGGSRIVLLRALSVTIDGVPLSMDAVPSGTVYDLGHGQRLVLDEDGHALVSIVDPLARSGIAEAVAGGVVAPMPGKVTKLHVAVGAAVQRGAPLIVVEAMKMEHTLTAPAAGTVTALHGAVGAFVTEGAVLVEIEGPIDANR